MQNLIIIGAGGLGREVYDLAVDTGAYAVRGFVDANPAAAPGVAPVLGTPDDYEIQPGDVVQLTYSAARFTHSVLVVGVRGAELYVAAHTQDAWLKPLSSYAHPLRRFLHVEGVRL